MPDPTSLYLFDGHNLLHAGGFSEVTELRDLLASFVAMRGVRGVLVFDGVGADERHGRLEVRYARNADALLERLAAEHRASERVCLVSSDSDLRGTAGREVAKIASPRFLADLAPVAHSEERRGDLSGRLDPETLERLERLRRGLA